MLILPCEGADIEGDVGDVTVAVAPGLAFLLLLALMLCLVGGGGRACGITPLNVGGCGDDWSAGLAANSCESAAGETAASVGGAANGSKLFCVSGYEGTSKPPKPPKRSKSFCLSWFC